MSSSIKQFLKLVNSDGKHGFYQLFPPALINKYDELKELPYKSIRLDDKRYDYFTSKLDFEKARVTDIGANIGYFSFRLASEHGSKVTMYEPYSDHCKAINAVRDLLELDQQVIAREEGVTLDSIDSLEQTDVLLLFNVLQHAGEDFDKEYVNSPEEWYAYAVKYLSKIRQKARFMVFQNGYSWLGHNKPLCPSHEILPFTKRLLEEAGWTIEHCGMVSDFSKQNYRDIDPASKSPLDSKLKYIEYGIRYRIGQDVPNYTFIQRPVYICKA